jgi:hypothetical protein
METFGLAPGIPEFVTSTPVYTAARGVSGLLD